MMSSAKVSLSLRLSVVGSADITSRTFRSFMLDSPASKLHRQPKRNVAASVPRQNPSSGPSDRHFAPTSPARIAALGNDQGRYRVSDRTTPLDIAVPSAGFASRLLVRELLRPSVDHNPAAARG